MCALQHIHEATSVNVVTDDARPRPVPYRLRSRAEQIEDELAAQQPDPPPVRRLLVDESPVRQREPGGKR